MVQDAIAGLEKALGAEGITSCNCLVKNYSKRKDVGARIGILLANHFGRHVIQCSRELCGGFCCGSRSFSAGEGFFHTPVPNPPLSRFCEYYVLLPYVFVDHNPNVFSPQWQGTPP